MQANRAKKESPYDHLPSEKEVLELSDLASAGVSGTNPSSGVTSPVDSEGKRSPDLRDGCSDLDYIPRSSPTVQTRSITPEHAQHLRKLTEKEGPARVSASLRGRRSPPDKLSKKSNTLNSINVSALNRDATKPAIPGDIKEDDSLYNVPRPSADDSGLYKVPKSVMDSPPSPRESGRGMDTNLAQRRSSNGENMYSTPKSNGSGENLYSAPRPAEQTDGTSNGVAPEEAMYKVPSSVLAKEENGVGGEQTSHYTQGSGSEGLYNVPRSLSNEMCDNAAYNDLQSTLQGVSFVDPLYNTPRPTATSHSPTSPSNLKNNYESIDVDAPRFNTLRSARSFESLNRIRVGQSEAGGSRKMSGQTSTPTFGNKQPKCEYVDIDIANRPPALAPAKNAPLPPLPAPAGPDRIVDSVYAEITEETIARSKQLTMSQSHQQVPALNPAYSLAQPTKRYDSTTAQEGMAKAQELAEEEGYELFVPAPNSLRRPYQDTNKSFDSVYPPVSGASALLQKYNINIHESGVRSRPFSESDVLEDSHGKSANRGTSIPDGDLQSDEYVIVTGPDRRPKFAASQNVAVSTPVVEDQYEAMNSAQLNNDSRYSTPNPSLWSGNASSVPQPQLSTVATGITRQSSAGQVLATTNTPMPPLPPRRNDTEEGSGAGIDLEGMSPIDAAPLYSNFHQHERQTSNLSSSSGRSEGEDVGVADKGPLSVPISCESAQVKIMAGSPMDRSDSTYLK